MKPIGAMVSTFQPSEFEPEVSEIEQWLADTLVRHSAVKWYPQVKFKNPFCEFFVDLGCLIRRGHAIGLDCDGWDYHRDKMREFCRDALILGTGRLACIYHIAAWAIRREQIEWMYVLGSLEPGLLDPSKQQIVKGFFDSREQHTALRHIYRRKPTSENVCSFLEFTKTQVGVSFPQLVERARAHEHETGEFGIYPHARRPQGQCRSRA